jgi:tape measure domain-containing protein
MANRISILVALEGADDGLKRALASAEKSLGELSATAKTAGDKASASMAEVKAGMSAFGEQVSSAKTQLLAFVSISWAAGKVQEIVAIADAWNMMAARLKLATAGHQEFAVAQEQLFAIAQRMGVPIQETATLYGKLQQAVRMLGGEQSTALNITESISQALRLSGASAEESRSALLQFGQALASGVLRGEEFNSVVENSPRLAQALADGLNVPIGRLRKMAEEGRLTADVVVGALMSQKDRLASEYAQLPQTVSQAFTRLSNAFGQWVNKLDESTGMSKKLADALTWLAQNLDAVMQALKVLGEVLLAGLIYRLIPALITAWQTAGAAAVAAASASSAAWASANLSVSSAVATVGLLKTAFAVLGAFLVGWEIGTWLSEKFETVRKAGIFMVEMLVKAVEQLQYHWEVFKAVFTSDTIEQATARHQARLAEMNRIFGEMYAEAGRGTEAAKTAMNTAASAAEEVARRLEAVRQGTQEAMGRGVEAVHTALEKLKSRLGEVEQAVGKANQAVGDATGKMAEAYKGLGALVEAQLQRQSDALKAHHQQEQAALELKSQSETALIIQSTKLLADTLTQQSGLRRQASVETLRLIDEESRSRIEAARRDGQTEQERSANVARLENEILATKRQTLAQAANEYRQHIDALNAEANRHLGEVKRIEEEKRQLSLSTQDRIREILRQGMAETEATEDRKRQIAEMQSKAREALAAGELEQARQFAQKAMDLAAQVASSQTSEAKRGEEARKQSEQAATQITQLEGQARDAARRQEHEQAAALMRQAEALRSELAQKAREADTQIAQGKSGVAQAIERIQESQEILNKTLDAQAKAHEAAAQSAVSARDQIRQTLSDTQTQIEQITTQLKEGFKLSIDADTTRLSKALADLDKALAEKEVLLKIQADLQDAQKKLQQYEQLLKEGKTLPVDADVSKAREALARLKSYADQNAQLELKVSTEKAQASISNVEGMVRALERIQTESTHRVNSNAAAARAEVQSLAGLNTSSTHTVYVRQVEARATGGLVGTLVGSAGALAPVQAFAQGGYAAAGPGSSAGAGPGRNSAGSPLGSLLAAAFPRMRGGSVPGSGHHDTVPRTLDAGAFVIRKAAVQKYGSGALARLVQGAGAAVAHFASGGSVFGASQPGAAAESERSRTAPAGFGGGRKNRDAFEAQKMIELGLQGMREYMSWLQWNYGASVSVDASSKTLQSYGQQAQSDRSVLDKLMDRQQLSTQERSQVDRIKQTWRQAMGQTLLWGKDLERELIDYMAQNQGQYFRHGGLSTSDTVPAMLTPGEYVVNREAVARYGSGFFEAINRLAAPTQALAARAMAGVQGFASGGLVQPLGSPVARPVLPSDAGPTKTLRLELAAGSQKVQALIDAREESRLLQLLDAARLRAV